MMLFTVPNLVPYSSLLVLRHSSFLAQKQICVVKRLQEVSTKICLIISFILIFFKFFAGGFDQDYNIVFLKDATVTENEKMHEVEFKPFFTRFGELLIKFSSL
jgi:hypothetical protein